MSAGVADDRGTIGERLRGERLRLRLTQSQMAALAGKKDGAQQAWEADVSSPNANDLAAFASAGADVLFILTGERASRVRQIEGFTAAAVVRRALALIGQDDRHRLLIEILAEELRG